MREPEFWWRPPGSSAHLLTPFAAIYGAAAAWRLGRQGRRLPVPVICVGNLTVGGAGKTPTALAVARMLAAAGEHPAFLTRGYGGTVRGPIAVDCARHRASEVGDEPLLLARVAPTIVGADRIAGGALAISGGASVIVMDDGFQNPSLAKDFSVLVIDARRRVGNGMVIPAGPLRAPLAAQFARAHALVVVGSSPALGCVDEAARTASVPIFRARLRPDPDAVRALVGQRAVAFAGIADPDKFFATLAEAGIPAVSRRGFPDHHRYTRAEAEGLCDEADRQGLALVTTEKDFARLAGEESLASLATRTRALPVELLFEDEFNLKRLLFDRMAASRKS
jgi:tetraacyldisaccharide 4'-kinase